MYEIWSWIFEFSNKIFTEIMAETEKKHSEQEVNPAASGMGDNSAEVGVDFGQSVNETDPRSEEIEPATLEESCRNMFTKISEYLQCELNGW